jgi:DNA polymerase
MKNKQEVAFENLVSEAKNCNLCPRMCERTKFLSKENRNINSKVIFIARAPGRFDADYIGVPLHGDKTGDNFEELLEHIHWERKDVFITNAILCKPRWEKGNNDKPTQEEIGNCSLFLKKTIDLVNPDVIVTLGEDALNALKHIEDHNVVLSQSVAQELKWNNKILFPLYLMTDRNHNRGVRTMGQQKKDFKGLKRIVDSLGRNSI